MFTFPIQEYKISRVVAVVILVSYFIILKGCCRNSLNDIISFVLLQIELRTKLHVSLTLGSANHPIYVVVHFDQTVG